jgi:hypothetical protein
MEMILGEVFSTCAWSKAFTVTQAISYVCWLKQLTFQGPSSGHLINPKRNTLGCKLD